MKPLKIGESLLFAAVLLLTACASTPSTSLPDALKAQKGYYPKSVDIFASDFFKATGDVNGEEARQKWTDEMSRRYGVDIQVNPKRETNSTTISGLYSIQSYETDAIGSYCLPLDDYLADNPVWNALPEDFKSLFEADGHIYAIPASVSVGVQKARIIHNEAIIDTGITVTDLESFREFALAYFKKTAYPAGSCGISDVTDILNAFGLYKGDSSYAPFSYDPKEDCLVDWLTKPAAVSALEYLRNLYYLKALNYTSSDSASSAFDYGLLASEYVPYNDDSNCTELLTLNPEYPQVIFTNTRGFALGKDTPQPQETVNLLIDMLFGSEQSYLNCWLGSPDNYILNSDGSLTIKMAKDSQGKSVQPCTPNLTSGLSQLFPFSDENIIYCPADDTGTDRAALITKNKARIKMFDDSLRNGSLVEIPAEFQRIRSDTFGQYYRDVGNLNFKCCRDAIIDPTQTVQQVLDDYKAKMLALGGNQMLDEMNAAIGKKTAYYYG